jgi:hypothetical protein
MEENQNNTGRKNNTNILLWGVIALLVGAGTYFFITKNTALEEKNTAEIRMEEVNIQKDELTREYDAAIVRLDQLTTDNASKDDEIVRQESELGKLRSEIESILKDKNASVAELMKAKGLISSLEALTTQYQKQIGALKQENIQLVDDKRNLTEEKNVITQEKEVLQNDKKNLEEKVDLGQVLSASNIEMKVINKTKNLLGKEKDKATTKARKADLLEINFDLGVNRIIESGEKEIHISVIDPNGKVIHATGNGAGKINLATGGTREYTTKKAVPYSQGKDSYGIKTSCIPTDEFTAGNYKVELYHKGYLIGKDNITLK